MKARIFTLLLLLALLVAAGPSHAVMNTVDNVPAATLLVPYFEVSYLDGNAPRPYFTIGNYAGVETLAHVTLWTDRGVPTYSFDVRLAANGIQEVDLYALFTTGTLPQTTAGTFASCAASLPPASLDAATRNELQRAHRGVSSTLLGGNCGGVNYNDPVARGYVTVDVTRTCTALFPGGPGYFVNGGLGIATNDNVIWGESRVTVPNRFSAHGTPIVAIEASSVHDTTDGVPGYCPPQTTCPPSFPNAVPDYTFYSRRIGSAADNREGLPQHWRGRFDTTDSLARPFRRTYAQVWRDPGNVAAFPCGAPPASLPTHEVFFWDDRENPAVEGPSFAFPYATQRVLMAPGAYTPPGFVRGVVHYGLDGGSDPTFLSRRQSFVTHVYDAGTSASAASTWPILAITSEQPQNYLGGSYSAPCSDGLDNDSDGLIDYPNDPGCPNATWYSESRECSDTFDNDSDTFIDVNDPQCHGPLDFSESTNWECDDGIDNDGDGKIDWPADLGCNHFTDGTENSNSCSDGIDNDSDGLTDYPNDPGCGSAFGIENPQCNDQVNNDSDAFTDFPADPGCSSASSNSEAPACNDGVSNDADGLVDYPNDPGCQFPSSYTESPQCNDGINNNDNDALIDMADPGCTAAYDPSELDFQCSDGIDNDSNGTTDFPYDTGCSSATDNVEISDCSDGEDNDCDGLPDAIDPGCANPLDPNESGSTARACSDGADNDGDGIIDYPNDPGCSSAYDDVEFNESAAAAVAGVPALSPLAMLILAALLAMVAAFALRGGIMS